MNIRTLGQFDYYLDGQLGWRKRELTTLKFAIMSARSGDETVIARAGVALLYAHWEGFIKDAGTAYVQLVARQGLRYDRLAPPFLALAARRRIFSAANTKRGSTHTDLVRFLREGLHEPAIINWRGSVRTRSNVDFQILREILVTLGLDHGPYVLKARPIIDRLVRVRNGVAHGMGIRVDLQDYDTLHSATLELLDTFRDQLSDAASQRRYET